MFVKPRSTWQQPCCICRRSSVHVACQPRCDKGIWVRGSFLIISELIAWDPWEIKCLSTISSNQYYENEFMKDAQCGISSSHSQISTMLTVIWESSDVCGSLEMLGRSFWWGTKAVSAAGVLVVPSGFLTSLISKTALVKNLHLSSSPGKQHGYNG